MKRLITELLPHAPQLRLYVAPNIPENKLKNAIDDYGKGAQESDVIALFDATLMGSAKDGALFLADRFLFQNSPVDPEHVVKYTDLIEVTSKRKLMGGRKVNLKINRARATMDLQMDCSVKPEAATYIARFLNEALLHSAAREMDTADAIHLSPAGSDLDAVEEALMSLRGKGLLAEKDYEQMMRAIR